mgnify:CR=1 FL=1
MGLSADSARPECRLASTAFESTPHTEMDIELVPIILFITFFGSIAYIAKVIGDTRIRRKVLEARVSDDVAEAVLNRNWREPSTRSALKWGLVIVALGGGILLIDLFSIGFEAPLAYAILLLATGTALLGYYLIESENDVGAFTDESTMESPVMAEQTAAEDASEPTM